MLLRKARPIDHAKVLSATGGTSAAGGGDRRGSRLRQACNCVAGFAFPPGRQQDRGCPAQRAYFLRPFFSRPEWLQRTMIAATSLWYPLIFLPRKPGTGDPP